MARVPLLDARDVPGKADLIDRIQGARRGNLINVYRMLLNSPPLAETWFEHLNSVRWSTTLSGRLREIVIIRIGHLTGCGYILRQHVPLLAESEGLNGADCDGIADWKGSDRFTPQEQAVLAYVDAMTRTVTVPDPVFAALGPWFDARAITELTVLIGTYNMHARVLMALEVDLEPPPAPPATESPK